MGLGLLSFSEGDSFSRVSGTLKEDPEFGCEGSNCPTEVPPPLKII